MNLSRFIQLVLTDEQIEMLLTGVQDVIKNPDLNEDDLPAWNELAYFLERVAYEPHRFPPTGKSAAAIKTVVQRAKGASQPQSRRNKRKDRQERRMRTAKERRKFRRQIAESYNEAREIQERENEEIAQMQREIEARVAKQPKYRLLAGDGTILMDGIPAEFIVSVDTEESILPKVIVPGS